MSSGNVGFCIQHTARTWGADMQSLLENHLNSILTQEANVGAFVRRNSGKISVTESQTGQQGDRRKSFWLGLRTQLSNPKLQSGTAVFLPPCCRNIRRCGVMRSCHRWFLRLKRDGTRSSHYPFPANARANFIWRRKRESTAARQLLLPRWVCVWFSVRTKREFEALSAPLLLISA